MSKFKPVSITPIIPEKTFRAFVQTVLPTIYDDSLSYYELLNKAVKILNGNIENINILSENQSKFIEEVTSYINSLEISIVPYDITTNFDVDTFDEMKATIANGGICCIVLTDGDGSRNYLYYSNDRYYSETNQNRMTFNGLTNIKNADDYSDNNAPSIINLSLKKENDSIVVSYNKKYKVATENDVNTAFANAIAISVQTYVFSYNVDSDTLSVSDVTRDIIGAINNNRICVCKVVEENKPDVVCYYSGRNTINNSKKLVFVGNIIENGVCVGTKTVNIDANAGAFIVEGVTSVNDKFYADKDIIQFIDFDARFENNELVLVNYQSPSEVYNYYRNDADKEFCVPRLRIINANNEILQEYYCFNSNIQNPNVANPNMNHMTFTFYMANDFTGYETVEISGKVNGNSWLFMTNTEYNRRILPEVTSADNGNTAIVLNGAWNKTPLPYVTPEMYGAIGDGVADDTSAIRSAFATGKNVAFGNGKTYKITASLNVDESGQIVGAHYSGNGCTILHNQSNAFCLSSAAAKGLKQCVIEGFSFSSTGKTYSGIYVNSIAGSNYIKEVTIRNCLFNGQNMGIYLGGYRVKISECYFKNCGYGIDDDAANNVVIQNNFFISCDVGIQANIPQFSFFNSNKFHACPIGLRCDGRLANGELCGTVIQGNTLTAGENTLNRHIKLNNLNGVNIIDNFTDGGATYALELIDCDNTKIESLCSPDGLIANFHHASYGKNVILNGVISKSISVGAVDSDIELRNCTTTLLTVNSTTYPQNGRYIDIIECKLVTKSDGTDGRLGSGVIDRIKNASIEAPTNRIDIKTTGTKTYRQKVSGTSLVWDEI